MDGRRPDALGGRSYASSRCNEYAIDCPFIAPTHRCDGGLSPWCAAFNLTAKPRVRPTLCSMRWNATLFDATLGDRDLYFIGDSIAKQQWSSLLCLQVVMVVVVVVVVVMLAVLVL